MKKLPFCTLLAGAAFAIAGTVALLHVAPRPDPFPLFFPLAWDLIMVAISASLVLRCDCARRAGIVWGIFCILASLAIGAAAFGWLMPQNHEPLTEQRMIFMAVSVGFGVVFGIWQMFALNSPAVRAWTDAGPHDKPAHHHG